MIRKIKVTAGVEIGGEFIHSAIEIPHSLQDSFTCLELHDDLNTRMIAGINDPLSIQEDYIMEIRRDTATKIADALSKLLFKTMCDRDEIGGYRIVKEE